MDEDTDKAERLDNAALATGVEHVMQELRDLARGWADDVDDLETALDGLRDRVKDMDTTVRQTRKFLARVVQRLKERDDAIPS